MKRPFNNAGFAHVQADVLSLPDHKLLLELEEMTDNFETWMTSKFRLTAHQREELATIHKEYVMDIILMIVDQWRQGHPIHFYKDESLRMIGAKPINYRTEFVLEDKYRISLFSGSNFTKEHGDVSLHILLHEP